jgi:hypothetical protein
VDLRTSSFPMHLIFTSPHKSIKSFQSITLPKLTIITGVNGAGKSHVLEALLNGCIRISQPDIPANANEIRRFDWNDLQPQNSGSVVPYEVGRERYQWWEQITPIIKQSAMQMESMISSTLQSNDFDLSNIVEMICDPSSVKKLPFDQPDEVASNLRDTILNLESIVYQHFQSFTGRVDILPKMRANIEKPIFLISEDEFMENCPALSQNVDIFQNSFAQLFSQYRKLQSDNDRREFLATRRAKPNTYLSQERFIEKHGIPPWDFVNQILESAELDFKIESPSEEHLDKPFSPRLIHTLNGQTCRQEKRC